jgi:hypothetical protein
MAERTALEHRIAALEGSVRLLAFDLDGTDAYRLPPPLQPDGSDWRVGEAHKITLHPRDVLDRVRSGQLPAVDQVNPESLRGLDTDNASGGARPNADLAFQVAGDRVRAVLRQAVIALLANRQILSAAHADGIRVFLVAGTFGGTGSGCYDRFRLWLLEITEELGVRADVYPILLLPGAHIPKDPCNSFANTFALLKEQAADATEFCWRPAPDGATPQRSGFRAPFLLSDSNNCPGAPRIVTETGFGALVGNLIYELTTTALGAHLDAQMGDFGVAGVNPTLLGEPKQARSLGYSSVFLDLERFELFSRSTLAAQFLTAALKAAPEGVLRQDVRAFLEGRALVLGDGRNDLANHLMEMCAAREKLSLTRLRALFSLATENLQGIGILSEGRNRLGLALQHCGDFGPALSRHAAEMSETLAPMLAAEVRRLLCDPARRPASAEAWLAIAGGVTDAMLAAAGDELAQRQAEINRLEDRIHAIETEYERHFSHRGSLYRVLRSAELARAGAVFRTDLEALAVLRVRSQATTSAIQVLNQLRLVVQDELRRTVQPILASLAACAESVRDDRARAVNHSIEFSCPNGLPLLTSEKDLEDLHARSFPPEDKEKIVAEFFACLGQLRDPVAVLQDSAALGHFFEEKAPLTLMGARLEEINVIDELRHRFSDPAQLGSVLRERDLEAYERLPLVSTCEQTHGLTLVRFLGIDGQRIEGVRASLEKYQTERGGHYIPVDTGDRERLAFVQVRAVFPFSDWRSMAVARAHYEAARAACEVEKQHVSPGNRFLPAPGISFSEEDLALILARAWIVERLVWRDESGWALLPGSAADTPLTLGRAASIPTQLAYRTAVDMVSTMNCVIRRQGVAHLRRRLADLMGNGDGPWKGNFLSPAVLGVAARRLLAEADWWERNAAPAAAGGAGVRTVA